MLNYAFRLCGNMFLLGVLEVRHGRASELT
jgi:hypothetical protein